jgi:hypothetical protein
MVGRLYPIAYLVTATALDTGSQFANSPVKGTIRQITVSWPDGCNFLVEVLFRRGKIQFYPAPSLGPDLPQGISLNDHTLTTAMNYPLNETDNLEISVINHDSSNSHTISAVALIEAEEPIK